MRHLILTCTYLYVFSNLRHPQVASLMLDMTPKAYDDQYINCEEKMEKIISTKLLEEEKAKDKDFGGAWDKAALEWNARKKKKNLPSLPPYFQDNHAIAILVYTDKNYLSRGKSLPSRFNEDVRLSVTSRDIYMRDFHFKSLHFYLTTGLRLFKTSCRDVHRGIKGVNFVPPSGSDKGMRFGQFTSSSVSPAAAGRFGQDSYFKIRTCYGVNIEEFSYDPSEKEVLIPTNEVFNVTDFKEGHRSTLVSTKRRCYYHNCAYTGGEKSHTCIYSSASSIAALASTRHVRLFQEFVISAAVLGLFFNL